MVRKGYRYIEELSIECYHQNVNITNFLKSLYFTLKGCIKDFMILDKIEDLITVLS